MIGKVLRGHQPTGLIRYLYGPGRREEHQDPHIVAGWRDPAELEPALRPGGRRDFRRLTGLLTQPHTALGERGFDRPVWHCVVRAAPEDRRLSDFEWGYLARDIMDRTGLARRGEDDEAVRWIAVRHAEDHIHIVGTLARQDGARPQFWNDYFRVREACQAAEERYGLRRTAPGDRTADRRPTCAEYEKARRHGRSETPRITLRRVVSTAAAGVGSEEEFFARLREEGVLVRIRYSSWNPGQVTGYAAALADDSARTGGPVWFGGGKLAADLSLPKLRARWDGTPPGSHRPGPHLTAAERDADLGPRDPYGAGSPRADPAVHRSRPGSRQRCGLGGLRHVARGGRHTPQPGAPSGRRLLRPGGPGPLRAHTPADHGGQQPAPGRPAGGPCPVHRPAPLGRTRRAGRPARRACGRP